MIGALHGQPLLIKCDPVVICCNAGAVFKASTALSESQRVRFLPRNWMIRFMAVAKMVRLISWGPLHTHLRHGVDRGLNIAIRGVSSLLKTTALFSFVYLLLFSLQHSSQQVH